MFVLLLILWIIFNGKLTLEIAIFGVVISGAVCFFMSRFAGYSFRRELKRVRLLPDMLLYILVLIKEIILANISVLGMIFKGPSKLQPAVYHFRTGLKSPLARTILANSITLTPGTITVSLHEDELYVHCLDKSLAEGISDSVFVHRLERMESKL